MLPHAWNLATRGFVPGGTKRNLEAATDVDWDPSLTEPERILCVDAQTSGGLLLAVAPDCHESLVSSLAAEGTLAAATIGRLDEATGNIRVRRAVK